MSMQRFIHIIRGLLSIVLTACSFGDEPAICPYNTRLEYWYAGSGTQNMLPTYVDNLRQYLFDADGQLLSEITLRGDSISGWQGELKDGTYTFVLWGNLGETNEQIITTKSNMNINEMTLSAEQQGIPPGYRGNTDRLYYGTATVEVKNGAAQRRRIYLSHSHYCPLDDRRTGRRYFPDAAERYSGPLQLQRQRSKSRALGRRHLFLTLYRQQDRLS